MVLGRQASEPAPDLLVCVVDATNLRLNLRLVLDLKRIGRPMLVALNMSDVAKQRGYRIDRAALERALGIPVIETVAVRAGGERGLLDAIDRFDFGKPVGPLPPRSHPGRRPKSRRPNSRCGGSSIRSATAYRRAWPCCRGWMQSYSILSSAAVAGGRAVPDVPGGVQLGQAAHGPDPEWRRRAQ